MDVKTWLELVEFTNLLNQKVIESKDWYAYYKDSQVDSSCFNYENSLEDPIEDDNLVFTLLDNEVETIYFEDEFDIDEFKECWMFTKNAGIEFLYDNELCLN